MDFLTNLIGKLDSLLIETGISENLAILLRTIIFASGIAILAIIFNLITKRLIVSSIRQVVKRTRTTRDDILVKRKVFTKLSHLVPALIIFYAANLVFVNYPVFMDVIKAAAKIYMILVFL